MNSITYQVDYNDWNHDYITILDPSNHQNQPLYTLSRPAPTTNTNPNDNDNNYNGNRLTITNSTNQIIGTTSTSTKSSKLDIETINPTTSTTNTFSIQTPKIIGKSNTYLSPAFGGQEMVWKSKPMSSKIVYDLQDDKGMELAHFESVGMRSDKLGELRLSETAMGYGESVVDEIVVTVLGLVLNKLWTIEMSNSVVTGMSMKSR